LPAPAFHGKDTKYGPEHLLRLRALKRLQQAHLPLDAIQSRLDAASEAELTRIAGAETVELDLPPLPSPPPPARRAPRHAAHARERWERIALSPGLELHVSDAASPEVRRIAEHLTHIASRFPRSGA
jgi:Ca-activated chloride channel family protein